MEWNMRRVVVTGLGLVTPLGADVETAWANLIAGKSGAGPITRFDTTGQKCTIACEVKPKDHEYGFDPDKRVDHKVQRQVDPFIVYGIDAAGQALEDAGLTEMDEATKLRAGVSIGSGIGGLPGIEEASLLLKEKGPRRISPFFVPGRLINLISGYTSIMHGLKGPNHAVVTACSTRSRMGILRRLDSASRRLWTSLETSIRLRPASVIAAASRALRPASGLPGRSGAAASRPAPSCSPGHARPALPRRLPGRHEPW